MSKVDHYEIFIRDNEFNIVSVLESYNKLEAMTSYNDVGGFMLEMSTKEAENVGLMKYLFSGDDAVGGGFAGIVMTRNGEEIFSGFFEGYKQTGDYLHAQDQESITFYGFHDNALLAKRILMSPAPGSNPYDFIAPSNQGWPIWVYPEKNNAFPPDSVVNSRTVHECLTTMFANNIGFQAPRQPGDPASYANRQIKQLYIPNAETIGPYASIRGRYQNLLEKAKDLSEYRGDETWNGYEEYNGMQFQVRYLSTPIVVTAYDRTQPIGHRGNNVVVNPTYPLPADQIEKKLILEIFEPEDKSDTIIFSPGFQNIANYQFERRAPEVTYTVIGTQNNDTQKIGGLPVLTGTDKYSENDARTRWLFHAASDSEVNNLVSKYGLREAFQDRRDIQYGDDTTTPNTYPLNPQQFAAPGNATATQNANFNLMYAEVLQAMYEFLIEKRDTVELEVNVLDVEPTRYWKDFKVGDIVTVILENEAEPIKAKVRDVTITLTKEEGESITARIATESVKHSADLFKNIKNLKKSITNLNASR